MTALPESLVALGDLPGARYVLVVDAGGERVRGELGGPPEADLAVLAWARRLADVSHDRGRALEDVVLTTASAVHLVRCVPGVGEDVWVLLRIDREHGNLALARRALAALDGARSGGTRPRALTATPSAAGPGPSAAPRPAVGPAPRRDGGPSTGSLPAAMPVSGGPIPLAPAPRRARDPELPRPASRSGADVPALAFLPPGRSTGRGGPEEVPSPDAAPSVDDPSEAPTPRASGSSGTSGATGYPHPPEGPGEALEPALWNARRRPLTVRQAHTWRTAPEVPEAREPDEPAAPAPVVPAPRTGSLFAPVVVVPPPPSPVDDDTTEVPAPVPYPIITAPPLVPVGEPAPEPDPAPEPAPDEPAAADVGLPRRVPGAQLRSPTPAPDPVPVAASSAVLPRWSTEASVLRRLVTGLRRLT